MRAHLYATERITIPGVNGEHYGWLLQLLSNCLNNTHLDNF